MMPTRRTLAATLVLASTLAATLAAQAQPVREPKDMLLDLSSEALIDTEAAKAMVREGVPAKVWKLYPEGKWTFLSQVEGGLTASGICVVTARVVMLPRTGTVRAVMWRPRTSATVFDAKPGASAAECKQIARDKLKESIAAVVSSLVKS
jgi:hypothetical protein